MKIEPQAKCSRSHPPSVGPITTPRPATADHMAIALARSAGTVKTLVKMESVAGITAAAPIPITTRQAMSSPGEVDKAASAEPRAKTTRPPARVRCRPMRSPRLPNVRSSPATARVYASTTHCSALVEACKFRTNVGSATLTMEPSTTTTSSDRQSTPRVAQRREWICSGVGVFMIPPTC